MLSASCKTSYPPREPPPRQTGGLSFRATDCRLACMRLDFCTITVCGNLTRSDSCSFPWATVMADIDFIPLPASREQAVHKFFE